jgi:hypothetical protein
VGDVSILRRCIKIIEGKIGIGIYSHLTGKVDWNDPITGWSQGTIKGFPASME